MGVRQLQGDYEHLLKRSDNEHQLGKQSEVALSHLIDGTSISRFCRGVTRIFESYNTASANR